MSQKQRLELTWIGKDDRPRLEPRILLENATKSYHATQRKSEDDIFDNVLIHGDNLLALRALEQEYEGKVKCVFIDPPYNTGSAFSHYDDGLEHSVWLSLMQDRLRLLHRLLRDDGSIWITIDDNEAYHLKIILDEVFGRANFISSIIWAKRVSPANDAKYFSSDHDFILVYAKNRDKWFPNRLHRTEKQNSYYKNPDSDPRGPWNSATYTGNKTRQERPNLYYPITNPNTGEIVYPSETLTWRYGPDRHLENEKQKLLYWGKDGRSRIPRFKMFLHDAEPVVPRSVWPADEVGSTQTAMTEQKAMFAVPFPTPKPEQLLSRIIHIASAEGDLVLDSFAGSGTTGAVAHKMGRRWIMVELGDHAETHIVPRMRKVIDGQDTGGITESAGWSSGGGFRFYRLAPSLLKKDRFGNWVVAADYNAAMLAESLCKLMGFTYAPSQEPAEYWQHGHSTERDFIYVTTQSLTHDALKKLSEEVGPERTLLICCKAFSAREAAFLNLTLKKIPQTVLTKCEWGRDDYSLRVANLPPAPEESAEKVEASPSRKKAAASGGSTADLFAAGEDV